jgi:hypothetical protein
MWQILYGVLAALLLEFIVVLILYILPRRRMRKLNRSAKVVLDSDCLQDMDAVNRTKVLFLPP